MRGPEKRWERQWYALLQQGYSVPPYPNKHRLEPNEALIERIDCLSRSAAYWHCTMVRDQANHDYCLGYDKGQRDGTMEAAADLAVACGLAIGSWRSAEKLASFRDVQARLAAKAARPVIENCKSGIENLQLGRAA